MNFFTLAAAALCGEPVRVEFRDPVIRGALGAAGRDLSGQAVIQISPALTGEKLLTVFFHECAHVLLHALPAAKYIDSTGDFDFIDQTPKTRRDEVEASAHARQWLALGEQYHQKYKILGDRNNQILKAIYELKKG